MNERKSPLHLIPLEEPSEPVASESEQVEKREQGQDQLKLAIDKMRAAAIVSKAFLADINRARVVNNDLIGRMVYGAVYGEREFEEPIARFLCDQDALHEDVVSGEAGLSPEALTEHRKLWEQIQILRAPFPFPLHEALEREEFVEEYRNTMSSHEVPDRQGFREHSYAEQVYFPGAHDTLREMATSGPVRVWTAGDTFGIEELRLKGSREQLKRAEQGGLVALQEELNDFNHRNRSDADVPRFWIHASEDKNELLPGIAEEFARAGVTHFVIIDDKSTNLVQAERRLHETEAAQGKPIISVLDTQGSGGKTSEAKVRHADFAGLEVKDIREIVPTVMKALLGEEIPKDATAEDLAAALERTGIKIGWLVDHDDVISNTAKAGELLTENFLAMLERRGIIETRPEDQKEDVVEFDNVSFRGEG